MKYSIGDCVQNTVKKNYSNGDIIDTDTNGQVIKVYTLSKSYSIMFHGAVRAHRVLESHLKSC